MISRIKNHLNQKIQSLSEVRPNQHLVKYAKSSNLNDLIFKIIKSSKFRKWSINQEVTKKIKDAININTKKNEPIKFSFSFGGYKLFRLPTYPLPDWAELFSLLYYYNWLKNITYFYKPGVIFTFYSDDIIVNKINNIPQKKIELYNKAFHMLIQIINNNTVSNFKFQLRRIKNIFSKKEFERELEQNYKTIRKNTAKLTEKELKQTKLNYKFDDEQKLNPKEKKILLTESYYYHSAYKKLKKRKEMTKTANQITVYADHYPTAIGVGTTKSSIVKFWIGDGILKKDKSKLRDFIIPPSSYPEIKKGYTKILF